MIGYYEGLQIEFDGITTDLFNIMKSPSYLSSSARLHGTKRAIFVIPLQLNYTAAFFIRSHGRPFRTPELN